MAELENREEHEEEMLLALLLLWGEQRKRFENGTIDWSGKETEDRAFLLFWLGRLFVLSARQHGLDQQAAEVGATTWAMGHGTRVISNMRRHTERLGEGQNPAETIFGEARAKRFVVTEVTQAQSAGGEYAKGVLGESSSEDIWFARNPTERRCPYCGKLHLQPRSRWRDIYYSQILPVNPELEIYGEPDRPGIHPNCNCVILYRGESDES